MTPDEQRIAIAEFCGWRWYRIPNSERYSRGPLRCLFLPAIHEYEGQSPLWLFRADGTERICNMGYMERDGHVPDYLNDLNAMRGAEELLLGNEKQEDEFILYLGEACGISQCRQLGFSIADYFTLVHATAAQRAEALLRTLNLWKTTESK